MNSKPVYNFKARTKLGAVLEFKVYDTPLVTADGREHVKVKYSVGSGKWRYAKGYDAKRKAVVLDNGMRIPVSAGVAEKLNRIHKVVAQGTLFNGPLI